MNHDHDDRSSGGDAGDDLQAALRQLRLERMPARDLWPEIASAIAQHPRSDRPQRAPHRAQHRTRRRARPLVPWAIAASCVIALALAWRWPLSRPGDAQAQLLSHQAQAMTREYQGALDVIASSAPPATHMDPALRELDRSAAQIRRALRQDPDARFLLDRLRHTYALRLALTQRAALT